MQKSLDQEQVRFPADRDRADVYALLAALLLAPDAELVGALAELPCPDEPDDPLAEAWRDLVGAAARAGPAALQEHEALFVAAGTPRINPYECWYRDGWLMDKPLARLRDDLRALGLARTAHATELEDHLGALCESMQALILCGRSRAVQQDFFSRHLAGWSAQCLHDIAGAPGADFYRAVARFAETFLELESQDAEIAASA